MKKFKYVVAFVGLATIPGVVDYTNYRLEKHELATLERDNPVFALNRAITFWDDCKGIPEDRLNGTCRADREYLKERGVDPSFLR